MAQNTQNTESVVPSFSVVEKSTRPDLSGILPDAETFAQDHPAGTEGKITMPDGTVQTFVLTAPVGWRWVQKRGRATGSKNATKPTENESESK